MFTSAKVMGLFIIFVIGGDTKAAFFNEAKAQCLAILNQIEKHPFIVQLANGTLESNRFCYYLDQDDAYLDAYGKALALLGGKAVEATQFEFVLKMAVDTIASEKDSVHRHYQSSLCKRREWGRTPALFACRHFLLSTAVLEPMEVGFASIIPCDWIYREVGRRLQKTSAKNNPYAVWIDYYAQSDDNVEMTRIVNNLARRASRATRRKMLDAFRNACALELQFWDDAYALKRWGY